MFLPPWLRQLSQRWFLRDSKRRRRAGRASVPMRPRVRPRLEVLEDRLTPSGDVLSFTGPTTFAPNLPSGAITVQLQDGNGNAITATSNVTVQLSSSSNTGEFFDLSDKQLANNSLVISAGSSYAYFEYEDSQAGQAAVTGQSSNPNASGGIQLNVQDRLAFITPPQTLAPGQVTQPITVQLQNANGNAINATSDVTVSLSNEGGGGTFLDTSGNPLANNSVTIAAGSSSASFKYEDRQAEIDTIDAVTNSGARASQLEIMRYTLAITTPVQVLAANQVSGPITVQLQDGKGNAITATSNVTVPLSSTSSTGQFFNTSGNALTIAAGSSSASFEYEDNQTGTATLTAGLVTNALTIFVNAQQQVYVGVPLVITTPPQTLTPSKPSQPITVQLESAATSAVTIDLSSTSSTGQFLDTSGNPLANKSIVIAAGSSSASFEYEDSTTGLPTITAEKSDLSASAQQQENVGLSLSFTTGPQTIMQSQPSQPITIQLQDSNGQPYTAPANMTVYLSSSSEGGFFDTSGKPFYTGKITIAAGSSSASFEYANQTGVPLLGNQIDIVTASISGTGGLSVSASQQETITPQSFSSVAFISPAQTIAPGQPSQPITVQLQNKGNVATAPSTVTFSLDGGIDGKFLDTSGNPLPASNGFPILTIAAGSSSANFEYEDSQEWFPTLEALGSGISGVQTENVGGVALAFVTAPQTIPVGQPSGTITVQFKDSSGNAIVAPSTTQILLSSDSNTGQFLNTAGKPLPGNIIGFNGNSSSASFEYEDSVSGNPTLTARVQALSWIVDTVTQQEIVATAPSITGNPSNQKVTAGQNATFTAAASGSPTPTVQWQISTDGGNTFTNISGATSTTLTLNNVTADMTGNEYQAVFTNSVGSATTSAATLTVTPQAVAPSITANPSNQTVTPGQNATFTASASGSPTPKVQWQVSTDGGSTFINISGATSTTLTLNGVTAAMNGNEYQAVFTNSAGSATTSAATLTVQFAPTVTTNPSNQTVVTAGQNASFTAAANGNPVPTVQWQVSTDDGKTFSNISGATSTTLTLNNVTNAMNGNEYQAVFTNSVGSATTSAAMLTVQSALTQTAGGYAALTAAVAADTAANSNYVIQITNSFTFTSGGQVSISKLGTGSTLTIEGQNGTNYTLTGNGNRLFLIASGQNVTFADLTLTGGSAALGGAILDEGGALAIRDSILSDNSAQGKPGADGTTPGMNAGAGGEAYGGGLCVTGSAWTVTLIGDTFSGNTAIGGKGGNGAAGSNATVPNTSGGNGGSGGQGGDAEGGAAYFLVSSNGSGSLTILNDATNPSIMIDNSVQSGSGGNGGAGGTSTGTARNSNGGNGSFAGQAEGGAVYINGRSMLAVGIGNTAFYGNSVTGGNGGMGGAAGNGGLGPVGTAGTNGNSALAEGGGVAFEGGGNVTMVNCTVAKNTGASGAGATGGESSSVNGSGIYDATGNAVFANNTFAQNTNGDALDVDAGNPIIVNNIFQDSGVGTNNPLSALNYNFGAYSANSTTNIAPNNQPQLGSAVGVDSNGKPTGGPIYYPLSPNVVSIGFGTTAILPNIASVEGTTTADVTDQIGNPRTTNGTIDLGAIETPLSGTPSAPVIINNPTSQSVLAGGTVQFTATAIGTPTPTVQWQLSTDGGKTFSNIWSLDFIPPRLFTTTSMNGYEYRAVFSNSAGSVTSTAAILTVTAPTSAPIISLQPSSQAVTAGGVVLFTSSAGGAPTPTPQWQVSTDGGKTFSSIYGAKGPILVLNNYTAITTALSGNEYRASFTNSNGSATSNAATLTVTAAAVAPSITANPSNQTVTAGQPATFTASASGSPTPTVEWLVSTDGGKTFTELSGTTSTTLTLNNATIAMNGYEFEAIFTNSAGSVTTSVATLTVQSAPIVTTNPSDQSVVEGQNTTFTVAANGNPAPTVQWQVSTDGGATFSDISGATSTTLSLNTATLAMNGNEYQAVFTNSVGSATTSAATLTVTPQPVPPSITANPSNQTMTAGQNATFTASAGGSPTPTVQWQISTDGGKTFTNISGATSTTLTLDNVTAAMNGYEYQAVFTNSSGSATTSAATLTVQFAPTVTTNPSDQTVTPGQNATFTAAADGNPVPSVQWQVSTDGGKTFSNISGATSTTLSLTAVTAVMNGNEYQAVFTNSIGSTTTSAATLNVLFAPAVTTNPSSQTVTAGQNATFTAAANGGPTPTVQWQVSTDGGKTFTNISGATSTTLTLDNVTAAMNGNEYQAVFTNSSGTATTSAAALTVQVAPIVTINPSFQSVAEGRNATFTASASGSPTPTVQWQVSTDSAQTFSDISGATSTTLTLYSITTAMSNYEYRAVFTNSAGTATTIPGRLNVQYAPKVFSEPTSQTVTPGQNAEFFAVAAGNPTPTDQWQVSTDGGKTFTSISGATSISLTLNNVTIDMNGNEYQAVFTNSVGSTTSSAVTLTVTTAPPSITGNPSNQTVTGGQNATFTASASGYPTPTVQWQVSTDGGKTFSSISGATSTTLTLNNVTADMNGDEYQAVFTNSLGSATTSAATLTLQYTPTVTTNPSDQSVVAGQNATFTASASGYPTPTVQWQVSTDGGKTFPNISGATSTTLTLNNVTTAMNGYEYWAVFSNSAGLAWTSAATLTVQYAPTVPTNPSSLSVLVGQTATFTAAANGNPTPTVQWQVSSDSGKTFTDISGATSTTLTLNNVTIDMNGNEYQAVFTNSVGSTTTNAATLTVSATAVAPSITSNPSNQTVTAGQNTTFTASASGSPTPTVQWQVSTDNGKTFTNLSGATSTTLALSGVTAAMNGNEYQAVFTNSVGNTTTSAATLTVTPQAVAPSITASPSNQTVTAGQNTTFTASASGSPTPTVQWQVSSDGGKNFTTISGATSTTLTLPNVSVSVSDNEYRAVFTNSAGSANTNAATLIIQTVPVIISGDSTAFTVGQGGSFTVAAVASPTPTLTESGALPSGVTFTDNGNGTATLSGTPVSGTDGTYHFTITAQNAAGGITQNFTLTVSAVPVPPSPSPTVPPAPPTLNEPPLLAFFDSLLAGVQTVNADGTETVTDYFSGIPLLVSNFDSSGNLVSVDLFGFIDITILFLSL